VVTGAPDCDRESVVPWRLLTRGRAGRKHYEDDGAHAWFDDVGPIHAQQRGRLQTLGGDGGLADAAAAGRAWSEGASELG
jgi:hypothetical protein